MQLLFDLPINPVDYTKAIQRSLRWNNNSAGIYKSEALALRNEVPKGLRVFEVLRLRGFDEAVINRMALDFLIVQDIVQEVILEEKRMSGGMAHTHAPLTERYLADNGPGTKLDTGRDRP